MAGVGLDLSQKVYPLYRLSFLHQAPIGRTGGAPIHALCRSNYCYRATCHHQRQERTVASTSKRLLARFAASAAVIALLSSPLTTAHATTPDGFVEIDGIEVSESIGATSVDEVLEFVESDSPKTVTVNVDTAEIEKVAEGTPVEAMTSVRKNCKSTDVCAYSKSPYVNYGFYNSGTKTGSWPGRSSVSTRGWKVKVRWGGGAYSAWQGAKTLILPSVSGATLTGVQLKK